MEDENDSIYAPNNKYGYKININHPKIRPLYEHYKRKIGAIILSDRERFDFEAAVFRMLERNKKKCLPRENPTEGETNIAVNCTKGGGL